MLKDIKFRALEFAQKAHSGQTRKYSGLPYINHPIAVASIAAETFRGECNDDAYSGILDDADTIFVVALLHDCIEDCEDATYEKIECLFGVEIATHVQALTKVKHENYLDGILRAKRSDITRAVKIADLTHNISDLPPGTQRDKYQMALHILQSR
jgi:(p)ppGpp synthase/HD superfamily hydrolase